MSSPEDLAYKALGIALGELPLVATLIRDALAAGHGDPVTRRKVADVLPVESESRAAQHALEAAAPPPVTEPAPPSAPTVLQAVPPEPEPPAGGAAE